MGGLNEKAVAKKDHKYEDATIFRGKSDKYAISTHILFTASAGVHPSSLVRQKYTLVQSTTGDTHGLLTHSYLKTVRVPSQL